LAEEGAVAEPRRLTTTQSSVRDEWGAACDTLGLVIYEKTDLRFISSV